MSSAAAGAAGAPSPHGTHLSAARRLRELDELEGLVVDLLVVGGGITGTGAALDAASRGLSVVLVERGDLAAGTSRASSKLVHGGLRYLAHGEVGIALQCARERHLLMTRTAPHLTRPLEMLTVLPSGRAQGQLLRAGLRAGDALRRAAGTPAALLPRPRPLSAAATSRTAPAVRPLPAVAQWDGQLLDDARLVIAVARTAASYGARILTRCTALALDSTGALVQPVDGTGAAVGAPLAVRARSVLNATGVWSQRLAPEVALAPSRGSHLVVRSAALGSPTVAIATPVPGESNRYVFLLPMPDGLTLLGITDDPLTGPVPDEVAVTEQDESFLLATASDVLRVPLEVHDVVGRLAGMRPLVAGTEHAADLSRRHLLHWDERGVLTVAGGKLTTYRAMAQECVDAIAARLQWSIGPSRTASLPLVGAASRPALSASQAPARLVRRFGAEAERLAAWAAQEADLAEPVAAGSCVTGIEVAHALASEGALCAQDVLDGRLRLDLDAPARALAAPGVTALFEQLAGVRAASG